MNTEWNRVARTELPESFRVPAVEGLSGGRLITMSRICSEEVSHAERPLGGAKKGFWIVLPLCDSQQEFWLGETRIYSGSLEKGSIAIFDVASVSDLFAVSAYDRLEFYLDRKILDRYTRRHGLSPVRELKWLFGLPDNSLEHLGLAIVSLLSRSVPATASLLAHFSNVLCAHLVRCHSAIVEESGAKRGGLAPRQLQQITAKMKAGLNRKITLDELASECDMSVGHFVRSFRQSMGESPLHWLVLQRIEAAKQMLGEPGASLDEIARRCGYADQACFTRAFRQRTGLAPGDWRRRTLQ